ncbi:adenosylcobinamide-phosphate synthase CbiB [Methanogenium organophilum]|uniref:Probable cobalamin biosynthesis protein CobD n=1 Tax=Methanogenium organophilum TaxID=2199 RepID=A0A9X9T8G8_METOG|nr:adenosylcobinamide-phosphate synthase CbiB [Methanogenium organophilum]WAI02438.1 adenosylcobinamide-phosphate synthase CbiB [Methanogenium organophilum]
MVLEPVIILWAALAADRAAGDPPNQWHPTAWLGRLIGWWGVPGRFSATAERLYGAICCIGTIILFSLPFYLVSRLLPPLFYFVAGFFLLSLTIGWRSLEEHVEAVENGLSAGGGREEVQMLVSRRTAELSDEEVRSAAYESMAENLTDAIIGPLFWFTLIGLVGAAAFRATNTMDAMLGYCDHRRFIGWFPARLDDLLCYLPARFAGICLLLWFLPFGRAGAAWRCMHRDGHLRPGYNGGITMALIAGGTGTAFVKPGVYTIGDGERSLLDGGPAIVSAVRGATVIAAIICTFALCVAGVIIPQIFP